MYPTLMDNSRVTIFTIGHSNTNLEHFLGLLMAHDIEVLVDTRTYPASRHVPHFGRRTLEQALNEVGVRYRYLGDKLGGRPRSPEFYDADGKVDYDRIEASDSYQEGIEQLLEAAASGRVCILCSEEDPLRCHRRNLIARTLVRRGVNVQHIRGDGGLESEEEVGQREWLSHKRNSAQVRLL